MAGGGGGGKTFSQLVRILGNSVIFIAQISLIVHALCACTYKLGEFRVVLSQSLLEVKLPFIELLCTSTTSHVIASISILYYTSLCSITCIETRTVLEPY